MDNQIVIEGRCQIVLEGNSQGKFSMVESYTTLDSEDMNIQNQFFDDDGEMNQMGVKALTNTFIQGLKSSLERGAANGVWDKNEHFAWIHKELLRLFALKTTLVDIVEKQVIDVG